MKTAGIICEYNPFHLGHQRQLQWLKEERGIDNVVLAMSGNFVQRGQPAVTDKETRTRMALACGADLVLELPALFALRGAYWFALGGVSLLAATGVVDYLAFGAETDDLASLQATARRLAFPDPEYQLALKRYLDAGLPYAEAQAKALCHGDRRGFAPSLPNDILAVAYLQVIAQRGLALEPLTLRREGGGYLSQELTPGVYPSAAACRRLLYQTAGPRELPAPAKARRGRGSASGSPAELTGPAAELTGQAAAPPACPPDKTRRLSRGELEAAGFADYLPEPALAELAGAPLVFPGDWEEVQLTLLRRASAGELASLPEMGEGLENRVLEAAAHSDSMAEFYRRVKTRRYPLTRLWRMCAHLYLDYRKSQAAYISEGAPYLRVLGANQNGCRLLGRMRETAALPVITRTNQAAAAAKASEACRLAWELEQRCGSLYGLLAKRSAAGGNPECLFSPIIFSQP